MAHDRCMITACPRVSADRELWYLVKLTQSSPHCIMSTAQPVHHERPRSPGNPTLTHHTSHFSTNFPTPSLLESVAGGAHYAGVKIDTRKIRRTSAGVPSNHLEIKGDHRRVIEDLQELYCCRPTPEILARRWRPDAQFEVRRVWDCGRSI